MLRRHDGSGHMLKRQFSSCDIPVFAQKKILLREENSRNSAGLHSCVMLRGQNDPNILVPTTEFFRKNGNVARGKLSLHCVHCSCKLSNLVPRVFSLAAILNSEKTLGTRLNCPRHKIVRTNNNVPLKLVPRRLQWLWFLYLNSLCVFRLEYCPCNMRQCSAHKGASPYYMSLQYVPWYVPTFTTVKKGTPTRRYLTFANFPKGLPTTHWTLRSPALLRSRVSFNCGQ